MPGHRHITSGLHTYTDTTKQRLARIRLGGVILPSSISQVCTPSCGSYGKGTSSPSRAATISPTSSEQLVLPRTICLRAMQHEPSDNTQSRDNNILACSLRTQRSHVLSPSLPSSFHTFTKQHIYTGKHNSRGVSRVPDL
eukprot:COSAG01_NODE_29064_length_646_cov_1.018282_1_plen_139_part_01